MRTWAVVSSGTLVVRRNATGEQGGLEFLFVHRGSKPFLEIPKGRIRTGESLQCAARRELNEEAGLDLSEVVSDTDMLFVHTSNYYFRGKDKKVHFFAVMLPDLAPQIGKRERSTSAHYWISLEDIVSGVYNFQRGNVEAVHFALRLFCNKEAVIAVAEQDLSSSNELTFCETGTYTQEERSEAQVVQGTRFCWQKYRDPTTLKLWWWSSVTEEAWWD